VITIETKKTLLLFIATAPASLDPVAEMHRPNPRCRPSPCKRGVMHLVRFQMADMRLDKPAWTDPDSRLVTLGDEERTLPCASLTLRTCQSAMAELTTTS
jgi:hypothetical protein